MKNILTNIVTKIALVGVVTFGAVAVAGPAAFAADCTASGINVSTGKDCAKGAGVEDNLFSGSDSLFKTVTNVLLFLIGAVSVIMLIVGGLRYVLSNGDSSAVTSAKNTILYAVIGIIVALLAYAIVNFVVSSFTASGNGGRQTTGD